MPALAHQETDETDIPIVWQPQPGPQVALLHCPLPFIGLGGARGGGKTSGILGKYACKAKKYGKGFNAAFFRQEMPQQDDLIEEAKEIYLPLGAEWGEQKKMFRFPGGGRLRFRALENVQDAQKYQGQNLSDAAVEEAGNYPDPAPIWRLFGALRSKHGTPIQLILSFNPGGPGHMWLKRLFWDPCPTGLMRLAHKLPNGKEVPYTFIPARVKDNKILQVKDPEYVNRLHLVGSPELVRAWLEGDFEIHEGAYFPEFAGRHIIEPFTVPRHWQRYLGFDWGYHSPFCAVWGAISSGKDDAGREVPYPKGAMVIYREYTGRQTQNSEIAKRIAELSADDGEVLMVADPSIFRNEGGPSIADAFQEAEVYFRPADNERIAGWTQIRMRLKAESAMIYFFRNCRYLIESLPALPIDLKHPEDCDTEADDHAADALRYLCQAKLLASDFKVSVPEDRMGKVNVARYIERKKALRHQSQL